jgi:hypothetical protein
MEAAKDKNFWDHVRDPGPPSWTNFLEPVFLPNGGLGTQVIICL